eukprot:12936200-Prorocentrum_lima.AAC.1
MCGVRKLTYIAGLPGWQIHRSLGVVVCVVVCWVDEVVYAFNVCRAKTTVGYHPKPGEVADNM